MIDPSVSISTLRPTSISTLGPFPKKFWTFLNFIHNSHIHILGAQQKSGNIKLNPSPNLFCWEENVPYLKNTIKTTDLNSQLGWMDVSDGGIPWDFYPPFFTIWETDPMGFITMKNRQQYFLEQCFKQASGIVAKIQANDHRISLM